jgi:pyridoxine 4-dehydrogenase
MNFTTLPGGTFKLADDLILTRMGYGAMQLAGPHVFGPPADPDGALAVLREVVNLGITHIDTSDFYGPHITNQLIKEALHPYPEQLRIVTKVGALRDAEGIGPKRSLPTSSAKQFMITSRTSVSTHSMSSICGSAASMHRSQVR